MITPREAVRSVIRKEAVEYVPGFSFFSTPQAQQTLLPGIVHDGSEQARIDLARATNSCFADVSGNIQGKSFEKHPDREIIELDNGTRRLIVNEPEWFYETLWRPLDDTDNVDEMILPSVESYDHYWQEVSSAVQRFKQEGFFVRGTLDGFYAGIWEHCCKAEKFMMELADNTDFAHELVSRWSNFVLDNAEKLIECGVDGIWWTDDLGSNTGTIISPDCYRAYFKPLHTQAATLAHEHNVVAMMHSHGNINSLLDDIVETGIDVLDPVGPSDGMVLESIKEQYGDHLTLSGGISRFIGSMSRNELYSHLDEVYRTGSQNGGFIAAEEGGVPKDMSAESYECYLQFRRELRYTYAN